MKATTLFSRSATIVAGLALALTSAVRADESDAMPTFTDNYIKVSGLLPSLSGSRAAFQRRTQVSKDGAGGIEALNYGYDLSKETNLQIDGKVMPGAGDYLAQFKLTKNEVGSFEMGYKRSRTYYDGAGGFFPTNGAWLPIYPRSRYVDRAKFFIGGTVALPKAPVFTFRYTNELRNGIKDSTIWGDSDLTGIPIYSLGSLNPVTSARKILPAYIQLGERQEEWEATVRHSVANTTGSVSVIGTRINNLNSRSVDRYTGELKPFPAIPANPVTLVPNALANNPNKGFDVQGFKENALNLVGKLETKLWDTAAFYVEASYRHATGSAAGSRLISAVIATATGPQTLVAGYAPGQRPPYSYTNAGSFKTDTATGVVGFRFTPAPAFDVDLALRGEQYNVTNNSQIGYVANQVILATGVVTPIPIAGPNSLRINEKPWTPAVELRYGAIRSLALYANWDYRYVKQDERTGYTAFTVNTTNGSLTGPLNLSTDAIKEKHSNLKLGGNWTPNAMFSVRPEVFTKDHENRFAGYGASAGSLFVLDYDIYGARVSAIVKPQSGLSFNTRYNMQRSKADTFASGVGQSQANDARRYQLSETIDWTPNKSFYVQANVNRVWDTIATSYPIVTGVAQLVLHNADNNYWNGSIVAGFVVDKLTDASIQATYYKADNYNAALATTTEPFGAGGKESTLAIGLKHKFSDRMLGSAKVGYIDSKNDTMGGNGNFRSPMGYLALEYRL